MTDAPTPYQLAILAMLCVSIAFLAGMLAHSIWLDWINRRALRNAAADAFMDAHLGKDAR
jgi:hypothetical protein